MIKTILIGLSLLLISYSSEVNSISLYDTENITKANTTTVIIDCDCTDECGPIETRPIPALW